MYDEKHLPNPAISELLSQDALAWNIFETTVPGEITYHSSTFKSFLDIWHSPCARLMDICEPLLIDLFGRQMGGSPEEK